MLRLVRVVLDLNILYHCLRYGFRAAPVAHAQNGYNIDTTMPTVFILAFEKGCDNFLS